MLKKKSGVCLFIFSCCSFEILFSTRAAVYDTLLCINVLFWHFGIFCSFGPESFLVLSTPWSPPEHQGASVGPGRRPLHVLWGFKVARPHEEAFRARKGIQTPANRCTGWKKCPAAHVISEIFNAINVVRHYLLGDGKGLPRHQHARHATTFSTIR